MATNFSSSPYFDDFDPDKQFYRVLFKPGYAVQARELNQMQSILQHQIKGISSHVFQKNALVIPGGVALFTAADIVSVTGIASPEALVGYTITNATSFDPTDDSTLDDYITAVVLGYRAETGSEPAALYVKYFKPDAAGNQTFSAGNTLNTVSSTLISCTVADRGSTIGKVATISKGVFYTRETFVDCESQSIILEVDNTTVTNCIVGLNIVESIVTSDDDTSLLDNANGSPNQYAPGADRYKIQLILERIDATTTIDDDNFIKMMTIENNVITYINNKTQYAELMTTLARRTYDANGNFIVKGLETSIIPSDDDNSVWVNVSQGRCYLGGYEYEQIVDTPIAIEKPRDTDYQLTMSPVVKYTNDMSYFYIAGGTYLKEIPANNALVQFLNAPPGTGGATVIGYGVFKDVQYAFGDIADQEDIYKAFFDTVFLEKGYSIADIGGVKAVTANQGAPVLHELRLSSVIGTFTPGNTIQSATVATQSGLIYNFINNRAYVIKNDPTKSIPDTETVKDTTTNATAIRRTTFITNYDATFIPMLPIDNDVVKTLYVDGVNSTSYSIIQKDVFTFTLLGETKDSPTLSGTDVYEEYSTSDYFAFIVDTGFEQIVDLTGLITVSGNKYTIEASSVMVGRTVWVFSTVNRSNVPQATKTEVTTTITIPTPSTSWMSLKHQDVQEIVKITDSGTVPVFTISWATNKATIAFETTAHGLSLGDTVVVKGVVSSSPTYQYNGRFLVTDIVDTKTFKYALANDPGTVTENGLVALPPTLSNVDITSRFVFESGNTAYTTGTGLIKLKKKAIPPQGQIAVQYKYYSVSGSSYISVDSYGNYASTDLSYIGRIADTTDSNKRQIEARRYFDFRTRTSSYFFKNIGTIASGSAVLVLRDLNLSSLSAELVGKYVVGPSHLNGTTISSVSFNSSTGNTELTLATTAGSTVLGTYYIGLNGASLSLVDTSAGGQSFQFPKDSTRFTYQYTKFKPKQVMLFVNRDRDVLNIEYDEISNFNEALSIRRSEYRLPLLYMYMKPYTVSISDIKMYKFENPVYHMLDIHELKRRIDRNEYYSSLALNRNIEQEIFDASNETQTVANRGFWNEDFMNPSLQEYSDNDFACTIYDKSYAAPGTITRTINLEIDSAHQSSTWTQTGTSITLPYTEVRAFGNDKASTFYNLNPFNMINWTGKLRLNPSVDNWVDTTTDFSVQVNNTVSVNNTTEVTVNQPPAPIKAVPPVVVTQPPPVLPPPPVEEIVTEINNLRTSWGRDSAGGYHAITFDWRTNLGRTGRVNTDKHLSSLVNNLGVRGYDGTYARSLINKRYNDTGVKEYLQAGTHFDQNSPTWWMNRR